MLFRPLATMQKYRNGVCSSRERLTTKNGAMYAILSMIALMALIALFYLIFFSPI